MKDAYQSTTPFTHDDFSNIYFNMKIKERKNTLCDHEPSHIGAERHGKTQQHDNGTIVDECYLKVRN